MHFIRNWVLPFLSAGVFALLGVLLIGLPGIDTIITIDGSPAPAGIRPEQIGAIIAEGRKIGSYLDVYGIPLPGEPFFWSVGVIGLLAFVGYRLGSTLKV